MNLAHAIAQHLPGWHVEVRHTDVVTLVRADGARIHVCPRTWSKKGMQSFRGWAPEYDGGARHLWNDLHEISCSDKKTPEQMAREIRTRLLPAYDHAYTTALAHVRKLDGFKGDAATVGRRIADVVGGEIVKTWRSSDDVHIRAPAECIHKLKVSPAYESGTHQREMGVSFEIYNASPELAAQMLALVAASERGEESQVRVATPHEVVVDEDEERVEEGRRMAR